MQYSFASLFAFFVSDLSISYRVFINQGLLTRKKKWYYTHCPIIFTAVIYTTLVNFVKKPNNDRISIRYFLLIQNDRIVEVFYMIFLIPCEKIAIHGRCMWSLNQWIICKAYICICHLSITRKWHWGMSLFLLSMWCMQTKECLKAIDLNVVVCWNTGW